jgi:hypothetical protein
LRLLRNFLNYVEESGRRTETAAAAG